MGRRVTWLTTAIGRVPVASHSTEFFPSLTEREACLLRSVLSDGLHLEKVITAKAVFPGCVVTGYVHGRRFRKAKNR